MSKYFLTILIAMLFCVGIGYVASANLLRGSNVNDSSDKYIWEHQLDYMKENNTVKGFPLKMLDCKYLGVISNEKDVEKYLDFVFSENSYLAINSDRVDEKFEVFQRKEIIDGCAAQGLDAAERFEMHRSQVANYISIGNTHIVEIRWKYKGKKFKTWALVDRGNRGFIFDSVASVARSPRPDAEVTWKKYLK